jgi:hypothetical protein
MNIQCRTWTGEAENDDGIEVECTFAKCTLCGHQTMSFGTSDSSLKRSLLLMRKECPNKKRNFYVKAPPPKRKGFGLSN